YGPAAACGSSVVARAARPDPRYVGRQLGSLSAGLHLLQVARAIRLLPGRAELLRGCGGGVLLLLARRSRWMGSAVGRRRPAPLSLIVNVLMSARAHVE